MPPRKRAEPKREAFPHADDCAGPRMESYSATRPDGTEAVITRCQECAAHSVK